MRPLDRTGGQRHLRLRYESSEGGGGHYARDENAESETKCHDRQPFPVTKDFLLRRSAVVRSGSCALRSANRD
jgi:hypothetical protein